MRKRNVLFRAYHRFFHWQEDVSSGSKSFQEHLFQSFQEKVLGQNRDEFTLQIIHVREMTLPAVSTMIATTAMMSGDLTERDILS